MQMWRIIATALVAVGGVLLVLVTMAQARDRRGSTGGQVAVTGAIATTVLLIVCVLTLTVLPPLLVWTLAVVVGLTGTALVLVS